MPFVTAKGGKAILSAAIAAAFTLSAGVASAQQLSQAQQQGQAAAQAAPAMQLSQVRQKIQQLNGELKSIQQNTLEKNDDVQAKLDEYKGLLSDTMQDNGFEPMKTRDRLNVIVEKVQSGQLSKDEQAKLRQEYEKKTQNLNTAQKEAMKIEEVRDARTEYGDALVAAMKEQNPKTEQLIAQLNQAQQQYQAMMQQMMQSQMQGQAKAKGQGPQ